MKKKILLLSLILISFIGICSCSSNGKSEDEKRDYLLVGTSTIFPPFIYSTSSEQFVGFDIELMKNIARKSGQMIQFTNMGFGELLPAVQSGLVDMSISSTTINEDRKRIVDFSIPYYETSDFVLINKNNEEAFKDIITKEQLGQTLSLAAEADTIYATFAKELAGGRPVLVDRVEVIVGYLIDGDVDAIVMDQEIATAILMKNKELSTLPIKFDPIYYGIAVKKGNEKLLASVNKAITEIRSSEEYDTLVQKQITDYFSKQ